MIPKRIFFCWGGDKLSWMRYMTFYSFRRYNPDWEIILYRLENNRGNKWNGREKQDIWEYNGIDYFSKLAELNINVVEVKLDDSSFSQISPIHKSDLFRYYVLFNLGGIYCDTDVIFFRSFENYYKQIISNSINTIIHEYFARDNAYHLTIGMLGSSVNNEYYKDLFDFGMKNICDDYYQSMGVMLIYKMLNMRACTSVADIIYSKYKNLKFFNLPTNLIYKYDWTMIDKCFKIGYNISDFDQESVGYHWYGGSPLVQEFNNVLNENTYQNYTTTFCNIVKHVLY